MTPKQKALDKYTSHGLRKQLKGVPTSSILKKAEKYELNGDLFPQTDRKDIRRRATGELAFAHKQERTGDTYKTYRPGSDVGVTKDIQSLLKNKRSKTDSLKRARSFLSKKYLSPKQSREQRKRDKEESSKW